MDLMPDPWHYESLADALEELFPVQTNRDVRRLCRQSSNENPWIRKLKNFLENWRKGDYPNMKWPDYTQWKSHLAAARPGSTGAQKLLESAIYFNPDAVVDIFLSHARNGDWKLYALKLKERVPDTLWMLRTTPPLEPVTATKASLASSVIPPANIDDRSQAQVLSQAELLQEHQDKARDAAKAKKKKDEEKLEGAGHYAMSTDGGPFVVCDQDLRKTASTLDVTVGTSVSLILCCWLICVYSGCVCMQAISAHV